jgi:drug/metabolite transporter (DMT)-like permease
VDEKKTEHIHQRSDPTLYWTVGPLFAALWGSAAVASKIGLRSVQPFTLSFSRFVLASTLMLTIAHVWKKHPLPTGKQWKQLFIYGSLNIALYLGLYIRAIQEVSPGLGSLSVAVNPVLITVLAAIWNGQRVSYLQAFSLLLGIIGVAFCAFPLILDSYATLRGVLILLASTFFYSAGTIYFRKQVWKGMDTLTINGWQTFFGALLTLPVMLMTWRSEANQLDINFLSAVAWLAIMVSIAAVQMWILMLRNHSERSSWWLFLTPIFGFLYAHFLTGEPLGWYTLAGTIMVLAALWMAMRK